MPLKELEAARENAIKADLMLVLGSSLVVNPAAALVGLTVKKGARVILINQGETPYDQVVTLRIWSGIGEVIPAATSKVKQILASPKT
jgi:NAD-dependent deacetylase